MGYSIERLVILTGSYILEYTYRLQRNGDLTAQAFEVCDAQLISTSVDLGADLACMTLVGGDMSLNTEYCKAELRAAISEGYVYN
jgi:hypothetical protein